MEAIAIRQIYTQWSRDIAPPDNGPSFQHASVQAQANPSHIPRIAQGPHTPTPSNTSRRSARIRKDEAPTHPMSMIANEPTASGSGQGSDSGSTRTRATRSAATKSATSQTGSHAGSSKTAFTATARNKRKKAKLAQADERSIAQSSGSATVVNDGDTRSVAGEATSESSKGKGKKRRASGEVDQSSDPFDI